MFKNFLRPIAIMLVSIIVAGIVFSVLINKKIKNSTNGAIDDVFSSAVSTKKDIERPLCVLIIGRDKISYLADVIMLVSFDKQSGRTCVLQIPRDTYAEYGSSYCKINGMLKTLGEDGMCSFFEETMDIEIDGYISLELEGFRALVDSIGGVTVNVPRNLEYSDPQQNLYINLSEGVQILNGNQAEMLVRYRSGYARGDLDRLDMQKRFLAAFFIQLKEKITPLSIYSIAGSAIPFLKTDISPTDLVSIGLKIINVDSSDIRIATLAGEDAVSQISGGSFYVISAPSACEMFETYFGADGREFDKNGYFLHPSLDSFQKIYQKRVENRVFLASELK